ncbi:hypothetical protein H4R34_001243 [Dimargaris verticillata]|uniref:50S ribosomal protein L9, chloroplastic n=1 Tax=Dimargaris verticillata TaxID=2761393 RepID=A0A9W8EEN1_9FUNG|nr:hypothetical protein H4R34_001243 [Dimargaris verticillata]
MQALSRSLLASPLWALPTTSRTRPGFHAVRSAPTFQPILSRGKKKATIHVRLLKDCTELGTAGDVIEISRGRMRHVLYPHRLAEYTIKYMGPRNRAAEAENAAQVQTTAGVTQATAERENQAKAAKLQTMEPLVFARQTVKADDATIFGSVSADDVLALLQLKHGIVLDKNAVTLDRIKVLGKYHCKIQLPHMGSFSVPIHVTAARLSAKSSSKA